MVREKRTDKITLSYDKDADVLYISEGKPRQAICQMVDRGVIIRKDPKTKKIIGFTVLDFISNFSKPKARSMPIGAHFSLLQHA